MRRPSPFNRRVGFRITLFEACSAFTRVTACRLAKSPNSDPFHQRFRRRSRSLFGRVHPPPSLPTRRRCTPFHGALSNWARTPLKNRRLSGSGIAPRTRGGPTDFQRPAGSHFNQAVCGSGSSSTPESSRNTMPAQAYMGPHRPNPPRGVSLRVRSPQNRSRVIHN